MSLRRSLALLVGVLVAVATSLAATPGPAAAKDDAGFLVGAAKRDITPAGIVNQGGFGLGDGSVLPDPPIGRGSQGSATTERIYARAFVVDNGTDVLAFVLMPNIGMFAKYEAGPYGLLDIADSVALATGGAIPAEHVIAAGNHSHSGPDTVGAWGGVSTEYLQLVHDQAVGAILDAYGARREAEIVVGVADGRQLFQGSGGRYDLLDNQVCAETASNEFEGAGNVCTPRHESVDSDVRVLQAVATSRGAHNKGCQGPGRHTGRTCEVVATFLTYAAHPTLGGAGGVHGDWPEFAAAGLEATYGGVGIAWPGTIGRIQPERGWHDRKGDFTRNLLTMVQQALDSGAPVQGTRIDVEKSLVRSEVTNPLLAALLQSGSTVGAQLMRSRQSPWLVGPTVTTIVSGARIGDVAFIGVPGEAYPQIALEAARSIQGERTLFTLGLADDMLGYLISHVEDYPQIAAIVAVNDNSYFHISPRIGDHVMCADLRMARSVGFETALTLVTARCPAYDAEDALTGSDV